MAQGDNKGLGGVKPGSGLKGYAQPVKPQNYSRNVANQQKANQQTANAQTKSALGVGNGTALPWDNIAENEVSTAQKTGVDTQTQIAANRDYGLREFGLDPGYNDPKANPYSQAAILQHNHESNSRGINTTAGQALYSGQTGNAQTIESGRTNQAHQGLVNSQEQAKARWLKEEKDAQHREEEEVNSAKEGAVQRGIESNHPEVPLPESGGNDGGGGNQKPPKPQSAPQGKKWAWNGSNWHLVKA